MNARTATQARSLAGEIRAADWERILKRGAELAVERARLGQDLKATDAMWALLQDAAQTSRLAHKAPPRTGYPIKSAMPETPDDISAWQLMSAYLRGEVSDMPTTVARPPQPSARQIEEAEQVLALWHLHALCRRGGRDKMRKAVYMRAAGVPMRKIRAVTGFSRQRLHAAKVEAMTDMLAAVRR